MPPDQSELDQQAQQARKQAQNARFASGRVNQFNNDANRLNDTSAQIQQQWGWRMPSATADPDDHNAGQNPAPASAPTGLPMQPTAMTPTGAQAQVSTPGGPKWVATTPTGEQAIASQWRAWADQNAHDPAQVPDWHALTPAQRHTALHHMGHPGHDVGTVTGTNRDVSVALGGTGVNNADGSYTPDNIGKDASQARISAYGTASVSPMTPEPTIPTSPSPRQPRDLRDTSPSKFATNTVSAYSGPEFTLAGTPTFNPGTDGLPAPRLAQNPNVPQTPRTTVAAPTFKQDTDEVFPGTSVRKEPFRKVWRKIKAYADTDIREQAAANPSYN